MSGQRGLPSSLGVLVAVASAIAVLAGCGSANTVSAGAGSSMSASASPGCRASKGSPVTPDGSHITVVPCAAPGGSSLEVTVPCDSGTATMRSYPERSYPDGKGVGLTETLSHVADSKWNVSDDITPFITPDRPDFPGTSYTAVGGSLVLRAVNQEFLVRAGPPQWIPVHHAWPQSASVEIGTEEGSGAVCDTQGYLDARRAKVNTAVLSSPHVGSSPLSLTVSVLRSGTITVSNGAQRGTSPWQVTVSVQSPAGVQRRAKSVPAKTYSYLPHQSNFSTTFRGLTALRTFTSVTVTASESGKHRTWVTLSRTP